MFITRKPIPVSDFATNVGVSKSFIFREAQRGRIALRKLGRRTVVTADEAERFLSNLPAAAINRVED